MLGVQVTQNETLKSFLITLLFFRLCLAILPASGMSRESARARHRDLHWRDHFGLVASELPKSSRSYCEHVVCGLLSR